jgi:hypothetical protein
MRSARYLIVLTIVALAGVWFLIRLLPQTASIADATTAQDLTLRAKPGQTHIYSLDVTGSGSIDGDAEICLMLNGKPYKPVKLHGRVHFSWGGDWYSQTATVRYAPHGVKRGALVLRYQFRTL